MLDAGPIQKATQYCPELKMIGLHCTDEERLSALMFACSAHQGTLYLVTHRAKENTLRQDMYREK